MVDTNAGGKYFAVFELPSGSVDPEVLPLYNVMFFDFSKQHSVVKFFGYGVDDISGVKKSFPWRTSGKAIGRVF